MELHFDQELGQLKERLLVMSSLAEESVAQALKALVERDEELALKVDANDDVIDQLQMEIDSRSIRLLALRQPMARDLRLITMAMKISTDLERIGDLAVNISRNAIELNKEPLLKPLQDIPRMSQICQSMIRDVLDAFVYGKVDLARQVIHRDEEVDLLNKHVHRELTGYMMKESETIGRALRMIRISQSLERIGDHVTNIAEEIVFLFEAEDIRHQQRSQHPQVA